MQTFLPYRSFKKSARVLDRKRLGKQRVEVKQIYLALISSSSWSHHPAVLMWKGYEKALLQYGIEICLEWRKRGYQDSLLDEFYRKFSTIRESLEFPPWLGRRVFHLSHKSNLLRKFPEHYSELFPGVAPDLPYYWPVQKNKAAPRGNRIKRKNTSSMLKRRKKKGYSP